MSRFARLAALLLSATLLQGCALSHSSIQELLPDPTTAKAAGPLARGRPEALDASRTQPPATEHRLERDPRRPPTFNHPLYERAPVGSTGEFMRDLVVVFGPDPWSYPAGHHAWTDLRILSLDPFVHGLFWQPGRPFSYVALEWWLVPWWRVPPTPDGRTTLRGRPRW